MNNICPIPPAAHVNQPLVSTSRDLYTDTLLIRPAQGNIDLDFEAWIDGDWKYVNSFNLSSLKSTLTCLYKDLCDGLDCRWRIVHHRSGLVLDCNKPPAKAN
jgi:hypothetical protein